MSQRSYRIVFAGGGTGGHLYPAIAIADEVKKQRPDTDVLFIGTKDRIEARVVPQRGYRFASIWVTGFRRRVSARTVLFPFTLLVAVVQSFVLLWKFKPDVVVGTGGYVCGPPVFVATLMRIPTLIQEQNSFPGVTTRLLAGRVSEVHLTFEGSKRYLTRSKNIAVSGNPVRTAIGTVTREEGCRFFGVDQNRPVLLVVGGSLGAASINRAVLGLLKTGALKGKQVIWATGTQDNAAMNQAVSALDAGAMASVHLFPFIEKMEYALAACALAVCRAGATTLAELMQAGVPSILIPYPFAAADHQTENARAMVDHQAAVMCRDAEMDARLGPVLNELFADPVRLNAMAISARSLAKPRAGEVLASAVLQLAQG